MGFTRRIGRVTAYPVCGGDTSGWIARIAPTYRFGRGHSQGSARCPRHAPRFTVFDQQDQSSACIQKPQLTMVETYRHYFNQLADTWHSRVDHQSDLTSYMKRFGVRSGDRILDVGAGVGRLTRCLVQMVGPRGFIVACSNETPKAPRFERLWRRSRRRWQPIRSRAS